MAPHDARWMEVRSVLGLRYIKDIGFDTMVEAGCRIGKPELILARHGELGFSFDTYIEIEGEI